MYTYTQIVWILSLENSDKYNLVVTTQNISRHYQVIPRG